MTFIREALRIPIVLASGVLVALAVPSGCASRSDESLGFENGGPPRFGAEAGDGACDGCSLPDELRPLCKATECLSPYATCPTDAFHCETNFDTDNDNCGACGVKCPRGQSVREFFGAEWSCESGSCQMVCDRREGSADCNHDVSDGCEINIKCDEKNCGGCGVECPEGEICRSGQCGCPPGLTSCDASCGSRCIDLRTDNFNCGTCGKFCPFPTTLPPFPNTAFGCVDAECGKLKCEFGFMDCNKQLDPDGCETSVGDDPENCGACGNHCAPGQRCQDGECLCGPRETACTENTLYVACADLDTNIRNCGVCGHVCPEPADYSATAVCRLGRCELECPSGWADCDGKAENGCETHVSADPRNCGVCGRQCDLALGQPCVGGACAMRPCDVEGAQ